MTEQKETKPSRTRKRKEPDGKERKPKRSKVTEVDRNTKENNDQAVDEEEDEEPCECDHCGVSTKDDERDNYCIVGHCGSYCETCHVDCYQCLRLYCKSCAIKCKDEDCDDYECKDHMNANGFCRVCQP